MTKQVRLSIRSHDNGSMGWSHYIEVYGHPTIRDGFAFASALEDVDKAQSIVSYINSCLYSQAKSELKV